MKKEIIIKKEDLNLFTLYDLMEAIVKEVPEVANKKVEIAAMIKCYNHGEKYSTWSRINTYFLDPRWHKEFDLDAFKRFVEAKLATHTETCWGNFKTCLEWTTKYIK